MVDDRKLTAAEAAARLGVKRQTLYAYVSRGLLQRTMSLDGKTSLFDPADIDALRSRRHRSVPGEVGTVIASSITTVTDRGHTYRGTDAVSLVEADTSFEAVADLIWGHEGPWLLDPSDVGHLRATQAALPPDTPLLDRLRVAVATLSATDPLRHDLSPASVVATGRRMLLGMIAALPKQHLGPHDQLADQLWMALAPDPGSQEQRAALNAALVLLADHDLAASTFAVRVAASVRADPYSLVSTGLGAVGGLLHGAASGAVYRFLEMADSIGVEQAFGRQLADGHPIPGVGHKVYRKRDPREEALLALVEDGWGDDPLYDSIEHLRYLIVTRLEKPPNVDFALGALTWLAEMDADAGELFGIARTVGWIAHAIEEVDEPPLRFRVKTRPTGQRPQLPED
ncbi:MAG: citrate/2-methylcitrate synthase [Acidimicrobiales bacterium]